MKRVKEGHIVDQIVVDVINAFVDRVVEEIKGIIVIIDRGGVAPHRFTVAARVFDAFVKNADRIDGLETTAEEKGADERKNGGDGEESPTFTRNGGRRVGGGGRFGASGRVVERRSDVRVFGGVGDRREVGGGRRVGWAGRVVAPKREAFHFEHRRNAERFAAFAGERLAGLRRFDRNLTLAARTG